MMSVRFLSNGERRTWMPPASLPLLSSCRSSGMEVARRSKVLTPAETRPQMSARFIMRETLSESRQVTTVLPVADERAVGGPELRAELGVHLDVGQSRHAGIGEQLAQPLVLPDEAAREDRPFFHDLLRPELDVGGELRLAADPAGIADEHVLRDDGLFADGAFRADTSEESSAAVADDDVAPEHASC